MTPTGLRVREATRADIASLVWCNTEAASPAPGFCYWDPLLAGTGTDTATFLAAVFTHDALAFGRCEDFMIVEQHGRPVAAATGFVMDASDYRPFRLDRFPAVANALGWDAPTREGVEQRYAAVWSDPRDPALASAGTWTIECVAVVPDMRGRGIARYLLDALIERGRTRGHATAGIAVTVGNTAAQRAYEAAGFTHYMTYGPAYSGGAFPGTIVYQMPLGAAPEHGNRG